MAGMSKHVADGSRGGHSHEPEFRKATARAYREAHRTELRERDRARREADRIRRGAPVRRPRGPLVTAVPLPDRIWGEVVVTESGCWEWPHKLNRDGYGTICVNRHHTRVHRVAWELANGRELAPGEVVRHHCDNPPCVNPDHLAVGTQADNVADMIRRGRMRHTNPSRFPRLHGEDNPNAVLTAARVLELRAATGTTTELAARFGISRSLVSQIRLRQAWKHVA